MGFKHAAWNYGCRYIWIDTACIDKSSSSEVDESIRSMFTWYQTAYVCLVYLEEYHKDRHRSDRWFLRGWTLQELLAPKRMAFFGKDWKRAFPPNLSSFLTPSKPTYDPVFDLVRNPRSKQEGVNPRALDDEMDAEEYSYDETVDLTPLRTIADLAHVRHNDMLGYQPSANHARRIFNYMHDRSTTVPEDAAYCLVGLLGITLPAAYGEGSDQALYRLQVACGEKSDNRNVFVWDHSINRPSRFHSMLPSNPFKPANDPHGKRIPPINAEGLWEYISDPSTVDRHVDHTFAFTNGGLRISATLHDITHEANGYFYCKSSPTQAIRVYADYSTNFQESISLVKLAVLGTFTVKKGTVNEYSYAYAIMLQQLGNTKVPKYRRIPSTVVSSTLPPVETLLEQPPQTVYIS
ncbi:hypothetical protein ONZ45_g15472 [Pleurotus djamor]|nr:hypothetical protein ONZ45_g15472 [Pleurotus djamor]